MPYRRDTFGTQWCREACEGGIVSPESAEPRPINVAVADWTVEVGGEVWAYLGTPAGGPPADVWRMDRRIESVDLHITNSAPTSFAFQWRRGMGAVAILDGVIVGNGAIPPVMEANNPFELAPPASQGPIARLQFDGAILAALTAAAATLVAAAGGAYLARDHLSWGRAMFSEFEDDSVDTIINSSQVLRRLNSEIHSSSARHLLGTTSAGLARYADNCAWAAPGAERRIFLRAGDIGNQAEQIPAAISDNTPAHFRFFPQAFFRRADFVREIVRTTRDDYDIIEQGNDFQPFRLDRVLRAPTLSQWYIVVDGQGYLLWFSHGAGDYRTGWEIWQNVLVPAIDANQATMRPILVTGHRTQDGLVLTQGFLDALFHRLRYLQYAALIELTDGSPGLFDPYEQTGAGSLQ